MIGKRMEGYLDDRDNNTFTTLHNKGEFGFYTIKDQILREGQIFWRYPNKRVVRCCLINLQMFSSVQLEYSMWEIYYTCS